MPFARTPIASSTQSTCRAACHSKLVFPQRVGCVESNGVVGNGIPGKAGVLPWVCSIVSGALPRMRAMHIASASRVALCR